MGLFGKKNNEYEEARDNFNSPKQSFASERIIMEQIIDDDQRAAELVDKMKDGCPLILNFEKLNTTAVNKLLAFFTGACYALDGNIIKINNLSYLFARKEEFIDGSLQEFIDQI